MPSSQFSVRISPELDARIKQFAKENRTSKSKVMIDALQNYLGCFEEIPLNVQIAEIKEKLTIIESEIKHIIHKETKHESSK
jgi:predicted transcriptional regulator